MRRILLCGMENLRDLGGYPLAGRGSERFTRWGSLYRGDLPKQVTQADRQRLRELGITTVVDLRSKEEIERKPDPLAQEPGIRYLHCPLAGDGRVPAPDEVPLSYMEMADGTGQMAGALRAIAEAPQAVLFHCTAGKDRTGVVAMLLLELAGVPDEEILADYSVSETYMQELFAWQKRAAAEAGIQIPDYMLQSRPEEMRRTLEHLHQTYGSAEAYLLGPAGRTQAEVETLRERLRGRTQ